MIASTIKGRLVLVLAMICDLEQELKERGGVLRLCRTLLMLRQFCIYRD
jgi:hypothetical protein